MLFLAHVLEIKCPLMIFLCCVRHGSSGHEFPLMSSSYLTFSLSPQPFPFKYIRAVVQLGLSALYDYYNQEKQMRMRKLELKIKFIVHRRNRLGYGKKDTVEATLCIRCFRYEGEVPQSQDTGGGDEKRSTQASGWTV